MSKNSKVETTLEGQTTKKDKTPTGKVKTLAIRKQRRKEHEEQYKNFRINSLKRRAKRMGLTEEQTNQKVEELIKQINSPNQYSVLIVFNPANIDMVKQALKKEDLVYDIIGKNYAYIPADDDTLKTIREILPGIAKIYPYVKKKPSVLADVKPASVKKPSNNKNAATKAKEERKEKKLAYFNNRHNHKRPGKSTRKATKRISLQDRRKTKKVKIVQLAEKKASKSPKRASTALKQAA